MSRAEESITLHFSPDALKRVNEYAAASGRPGVAFIVEELRRSGVPYLPPSRKPRSPNIQARTQLCLPHASIAYIVEVAARQGLNRNAWARSIVLKGVERPLLEMELPRKKALIRRGHFPDYDLSFAETLDDDAFKALQADKSLHPVTGQPWVSIHLQGDSRWPYGLRLPLKRRPPEVQLPPEC